MDDKKYIAILESKLDQTETELRTLNTMLIAVGFEKGIETLKLTIDELLEEGGLDLPQQIHREDSFE